MRIDKKQVMAKRAALSKEGGHLYDAIQQNTKRLSKYVNGKRISLSDSVDKLLLDDRLETSVDSQGETLLKNIHDLITNPDIPKSRRRDVVGWTVTHLAHPEESLEQVGSAGTCTASVLAFDLAKDEPAEFARIVEGLSSKAHEVTLANGEVMTRAPGVGSGGTVGTIVEEMLQGSFMSFAKPDEVYRIVDDEFAGEENPGLVNDEIERLYEAVLGTKLDVRAIDQKEMRSLLDTVDETLPVAIKWSDETSEDGERTHSYHMLLATDMNDNWVEFRNPWGSDTQGNETLVELGREVLDNGHERLPTNVFFDRFDVAVVPEGWQLEPSTQTVQAKNEPDQSQEIEPASVPAPAKAPEADPEPEAVIEPKPESEQKPKPKPQIKPSPPPRSFFRTVVDWLGF